MLRRPTTSKTQGEKEKERARGDAVANAILVGQVGSMSLEEVGMEGPTVAASKEPSPLTAT